MKPEKINAIIDVFDKTSDCKKFSSESNNNYFLRNQTNEDVIENQIFIGKMGEWAAYRYLKEHKHDISEPDMTIFSKEDKFKKGYLLWEPDLGNNFTVKTCLNSTSERFGTSWTFNISNDGSKRGGKDKIFYNIDKDYNVVFVESINNRKFNVKFIVPTYVLFSENMFGYPKKDSLRSSKRVVYEKSPGRKYLSGKSIEDLFV